MTNLSRDNVFTETFLKILINCLVCVYVGCMQPIGHGNMLLLFNLVAEKGFFF